MEKVQHAFVAKPLVTTVAGIVDPPDPTATPRPTPEINQTGKTGEALLVLDTYYTCRNARNPPQIEKNHVVPRIAR